MRLVREYLNKNPDAAEDARLQFSAHASKAATCEPGKGDMAVLTAEEGYCKQLHSVSVFCCCFLMFCFAIFLHVRASTPALWHSCKCIFEADILARREVEWQQAEPWFCVTNCDDFVASDSPRLLNYVEFFRETIGKFLLVVQNDESVLNTIFSNFCWRCRINILMASSYFWNWIAVRQAV